MDRLSRRFSKYCPLGYEVDVKTVKSDIKELRDLNFYIEEYIGKQGKKFYYYSGELFEVYEVRILLDAVYSARSITNNERKNLIKKINTLTNKSNSKIYDSKLYIPQLVVSENKLLKHYLDDIHKAIYNSKKLRFQYGNYDTDKNFKLFHNGKDYIVHPYNLVWYNDFYYLVAYDESKKSLINFRVDRMRSASTMEDEFQPNNDFDIVKYLSGCFNMYPGEVQVIQIKFVNKLINAIIDRFGKDVNIINKDNDFFTISIEAAINEGLKRWLLNWGSDAEVISPSSLRNIMMQEIKKMSTIY
jgi:predicted DNA-binding transcriptional regulator YafY